MEKSNILSEPNNTKLDRIAESNEQGQEKQRKETRSIVTPYAFEVAPFLFGTPLASPIRRAMALLIDLLFVAILSGVSGNALAVFVAGLLWMSTRRLKRENRSSRLIYGIRAGALSLFLLGFLGGVNDPFFNLESPDQNVQTSSDLNFEETDAKTAIAVTLFTAKYLIDINALNEGTFEGDCELPFHCWQLVGEEFVEGLPSLDIKASTAGEMLSEFLQNAEQQLSDVEYQALEMNLKTLFETKKFKQSENESINQDVLTDPQNIEEVLEPGLETSPENKQQSSFLDHSVIKWMQGIVSDLGLGFGWAAFYFTATMGLLKGQTIGKKILGIKVIKLDGSALNLWESFGRYGGYGAGLATGLMGFLQVFWDPNRQAIQDKISETLVIRKID